jgi:hypothetical protein
MLRALYNQLGGFGLLDFGGFFRFLWHWGLLNDLMCTSFFQIMRCHLLHILINRCLCRKIVNIFRVYLLRFSL